MPRTPKTPQDKKRLSLQKDRRNAYGQNDKASRNAIPRAKAKSHRGVRHKSKAALERSLTGAEGKAETLQSTLATPCLQKGVWRKEPDIALGRIVTGKRATRVATIGAQKKRWQAKRAT